jgi:predicted secreted protein
VTLKLSGLKHGVLKFGKGVTAKGTVTPTSLAGSKVTLTAQLKKGSKWVKAKTASATINSTGSYSWRYKSAKRGTYRIEAAIAKTAAHMAARTKWHTFKVK